MIAPAAFGIVLGLIIRFIKENPFINENVFQGESN